MNNEQLINEFLVYLKKNDKTKSTLIAYTNDIKQLSSTNVSKSLSEFSTNDIKYSLDYLHNTTGLSFKTISRKLNSIRTFYKFLTEKSYIKENPANQIPHPKFKLKKPRVLSKVEYLALREVSRDNPRLYTMIELLIQTGIRIGELARLKVKDIHIDNSHGFTIIEAFSSNSERVVPLNQKIKNILKEYLDEYKFKNKPNHPLFCTKNGKSIEIRNIRSSIDRAIIKSKVKNACVNDIRNTFIVFQLTKGMPLSRVSEIIGHKSIVTTSRYLELLTKKYKPSGIEMVSEL